MAVSQKAANPTRRGRRPGHRIALLIMGSFLLFFFAVLLYLAYTAPVQRRDQPGWNEAAAMPGARGELTAALGQRASGCQNPPCEVVFAIGGFKRQFITSQGVQGYLPDEDRWISLPDLPEARHHPAAAALPDGTVVLTGGAVSVLDWTPMADVWALAPDSDDWVALDPLPDARWGHRLIAVEDRLVLVGGYGGEDTLIWSFAEGWRRSAPIPDPRDHLGAVNVDDEIWVIGGRDERITRRVDVYDPGDETWRNGPNLPVATSAAAVGLIDRALVVVAGEDDRPFRGGMIREAWMLDVDNPKNGWRPMTKAPVDLHGAGDVVVGQGADARLLIIGGGARNGAFSALAWNDRTLVLEQPGVRVD